jgi:dienelactone hydrolase
VHGSGPQDRDVSIGPNKPFRDLARGLASRRIVVLRYDKRTRVHGAKLAAMTQFTVNDETVDDAVAAVRLLRSTPGVDPNRVYVLGHSLGGSVAPRIAAAAGRDIAGVVILAGAVRSLQQSLLDQSRYLAHADGSISPEEEKQLAEVEQFAKSIDALKPGDLPPAMPGISAPTSYWLDLRDYDAPAAAAALEVPMLVLQGGRDYQVTSADFEKWKAALANRKDVSMKLYPALNHLFISGTGASVPGEYFTAGHVDEQVIRDIADWIGSQRR